MADINLGDFIFFKLINEYFTGEIDRFGLQVMERAAAWVSAIALTATTLWVLLLGYRIVTGQSRQSAAVMVTSAARVVFIVGLASALGTQGSSVHNVTRNLDREIHALFTGTTGSSADAIDRNLALTQVALTALDAVRVVPGDPEALQKKGRAIFLAGFGTASPPMAAAAMLMLFKFTMAFLIGVGPIFVLFLMFEQTRELFRKWLFYVLGTLFSMSLLSVVTSMVLVFTEKVAAAYWVANSLLLADAEGLSTRALQQGGIGLLMTVLIISVPSLGAAVWQGQMASFMSWSAFGGAGASPPIPVQGAGLGQLPQSTPTVETMPASRTAEGADGQGLAARASAELVGTQRAGSRGLAGRRD